MLKSDKIFIAKKEDYEEKAEDLHVDVVHDCNNDDDVINESIVSGFKKKKGLLCATFQPKKIMLCRA